MKDMDKKKRKKLEKILDSISDLEIDFVFLGKDCDSDQTVFSSNLDDTTSILTRICMGIENLCTHTGQNPVEMMIAMSEVSKIAPRNQFNQSSPILN